jgi:hypothetical protein
MVEVTTANMATDRRAAKGAEDCRDGGGADDAATSNGATAHVPRKKGARAH